MKTGKIGITGTVVEIEQAGAYEIEKGNEFSCPFSIVAGIGGDPSDFQVTIGGDENAVDSIQNFAVVPAGQPLIGATNVVAILQAKQPGKATVTLQVKGVDKQEVYEITVI
jgi:hypothetical protein